MKMNRTAVASIQLSIVIPARDFEPSLAPLLEALESELSKASIAFEIIVSVAPNSDLAKQSPSKAAIVIAAPNIGRSHQLNFGAEKSAGEWLLFLHADSVLEKRAIDVAIQTMDARPPDVDFLYYFWLQFESDGPVACRLNAFFVNLRSRFLGLPFGDQGFLLRREAFFRLGQFPNALVSGEDHALIQKAKKQHFSIKPMSGWIKVTARHLYLTVKQEIIREDQQR